MTMPELASDPVKTISVFPKSIALSLSEMLFCGYVYEFFDSVGKLALLSVVAVSKFFEFFAELFLIF